MRAAWSFGPDRVGRALVVVPGMTAQMRDCGVFQSPASLLAEFHVDRAKAEDPRFGRELEKAAAEYVREIYAPRDPITWEGDGA